LLETAPLLAEELLEVLLLLGQDLLLTSYIFGAAGGLTLALLQQVVLAIELGLLVLDAPFLALDFLAAAAGFDLPLLAQLDQLFLAGEDCGLARAFRLALCVTQDLLCGLFRRRLGVLLTPQLNATAAFGANYKKNRTGNYKQTYASCGQQSCVRHIPDLCWARGQNHRRPLSRCKVVA